MMRSQVRLRQQRQVHPKAAVGQAPDVRLDEKALVDGYRQLQKKALEGSPFRPLESERAARQVRKEKN